MTSSILTFIAVLVLCIVIYYTHKKREQEDIDFHNNLVESFKEIDLKANELIVKLDGVIKKLDNFKDTFNRRFDEIDEKLNKKLNNQEEEHIL